MLDKIKMLDSNTVRGLIVATIPLLVLIASFFGVDEAVFQAKLEGIGEKLVALVSLLGVAWAAYSRVFMPSPPLTDKAKAMGALMAASQPASDRPPSAKPPGAGGYARAGMLALILAISAVLMALPGCAQLGLQTSGGFNDRLAGGYSLVTAISDGAGVLLDSKVRVARMEPDPTRRDQLLSAAKADAQNLKDQAQKAKDGLDVARSMRGINFEDADQRLTSTLLILEALQKYLEEQQ